MKMNFRDFFRETDWADDLRLTDEEWAYHLSFNEQLGISTDYDDVMENLPEFASMAGNLVVESKRKKAKREEPVEVEDDEDDDSVDADVDVGTSKTKKDDEKNKLVNFTRQQWDQHQDDIKDMFRPRRDKKRRLKNPHAGLSLVSPGDNNPKTEKGYPHAVANPHHGMMRPMKNAVMHLLPAGFSGCNTCSAHTPECAASCLDVAGNPGFMGVKTSGRMRRTFMFAYNKNAALTRLAQEVEHAAAESHSQGFNFGLRLNGTSDIPWETEKYWFTYQRKNPKTKGKELPGYEGAVERSPKARAMNCPPDPNEKKSIFCHFPEVQFYDYTKVIGRAMKHAEAMKSGGGKWPANYHLTFSYSEKTNLHQMEELLDNGGNVAMVFAFAEKNYDPAKAKRAMEARAQTRARKSNTEYVAPEFKEDPKGKEYAVDPNSGAENGPYKLPKVWRGENGKLYRIVSGDIHDLRFIDDMQKGKNKTGVIIGLAAKGDAKYVQSNGQGKQVFVVQPDDPHLRYEEENKGWVIAASKAHPQRLKTVAARQAKDTKLVAELRAKAATATGEEKEELLARADRIEQGIVNYFGPNAQRRRSNAIYDLAQTPDSKSDENPDGLSPMELTRSVFQAQARRDLSNRINREIRDAERAGITREELMKGVKPTEKRRAIKWEDADKDAYHAAVAKKYQDEDFDGLTPFKRDDRSPHYLATDKGRAPNDQLSGRIPLPMTTAPSALDQHIGPRRKAFDDEYAAAIGGGAGSGPATKPVGAVVPKKKKRRVVAAESTNPYLSDILDLCCD